MDELVLQDILTDESIAEGAKSFSLDVATIKKKSLQKLIKDSHENPMDYLNSMPWGVGIDKNRPPKNPDYCWLAGTQYHNALSPEQKCEILWLQVAYDVSMFIRLEQILPVLYMGYINKYHQELPADIYEFLMIFSKEEIVHTMVFRKYLQVAGLEIITVSLPEEDRLQLEMLASMHPIAGILFTLLIEWLAEQNATWNTKDKNIDFLTKKLFYLHHIDESRHIAFARWVIESYISQADAKDLVILRNLAKDIVHKFVYTTSFHPHIALHTTFDFPIGVDESYADEIHKIRCSNANSALNAKKYKPVYSWLKKVHLL